MTGDCVQVFAGLAVALIGGLEEEPVGLLVILFHAVAGVVAGTHVVLGEHMAGGRGLFEPFHGDVVVEIHLHAERVAPAHFVLGLHIAGCGFGFQYFQIKRSVFAGFGIKCTHGQRLRGMAPAVDQEGVDCEQPQQD